MRKVRKPLWTGSTGFKKDFARYFIRFAFKIIPAGAGGQVYTLDTPGAFFPAFETFVSVTKKPFLRHKKSFLRHETAKFFSYPPTNLNFGGDIHSERGTKIGEFQPKHRPVERHPATRQTVGA
jgi:hypothetical protein